MFSPPWSFSSHTCLLISEAKWYHSHLSDEVGSEKLGDIPKVTKLINSGTKGKEIPGIEQEH